MADNWNVKITHDGIVVEVTRMGSMLAVHVEPKDGEPMAWLLNRSTAQMIQEALTAALSAEDKWPG